MHTSHDDVDFSLNGYIGVVDDEEAAICADVDKKCLECIVD